MTSAMTYGHLEVGEPKDGEIRIKNTAIGVNFIDVYYREGVYSAPLPFVPGMEAVGVVTAVGPGLTGRKVGDVVAYAGKPMGSYAQEQIIPASVAVPLPPSIDHKTAAAIMLKGMTAHVLLRRVFKVQSGDCVLVHAAAGGVGSLLCQWANALGATVIGTVSNEEKAAQAAQDGCHHVIIYTKEDVVTRVKEFTAGKGVNVVYDSVGKETYKASVECLASRGMLVSFGQSSGRPDPIPLSDLATKSLFVTRPSLMHYTATRDELLESAGEPLWAANSPRPWDPPLTDAGLLRAWTVANRIRSAAAADDFQIHRVLVSPFIRCLQTAAQAVAALCALPDDNALLDLHRIANVPLDPSRIKVSIEYGLSEMMNAQAMGLLVSQVAPSIDKWFPDLSQLEAVLPAGTIDHSAEPLYPEVPRWGESVWEARSRYASVIKALADKYPDENLLLVTHGEGVGASVSFFEPGVEIYEVEYCAYSVLGRRRQQQQHKVGLEGGGEEEEEEGLNNLRVLSTSGPTGIHYYYTTPAPAVAAAASSYPDLN
ncbi:hypothetical protein E2562_012124 [Oryza meyeriana var. granulata]|uniref:Probable quinone oxidoreductase n=1 Tax=Oryza meyeriana var. granulata TaxID=110450 RepID=A0A6G1F780_9ORYZ|nr:hypothetical protein E2562_012124 [Oryza meyeriana var. granulata]